LKISFWLFFILYSCGFDVSISLLYLYLFPQIPYFSGSFLWVQFWFDLSFTLYSIFVWRSGYFFLTCFDVFFIIEINLLKISLHLFSFSVFYFSLIFLANLVFSILLYFLDVFLFLIPFLPYVFLWNSLASLIFLLSSFYFHFSLHSILFIPFIHILLVRYLVIKLFWLFTEITSYTSLASLLLFYRLPPYCPIFLLINFLYLLDYLYFALILLFLDAYTEGQLILSSFFV
jgi:hypothetical protein